MNCPPTPALPKLPRIPWRVIRGLLSLARNPPSVLVLCMLFLFGCAGETTLSLPSWDLHVPSGTVPVRLPTHLEDRLPPSGGDYELSANVTLPEAWRGNELTLVVPYFIGRIRAQINGEEALLLEDVLPSDYRRTVPHRFWIRPDLSKAAFLEIRLQVSGTSPWSPWFDTVPRLSMTPEGDSEAVALRHWQRLSPGVLLSILLWSIVALAAIYAGTEREDMALLSFALVSGIWMAIFWLGWSQRLLGTADAYFFFLAISFAVMVLLRVHSLAMGNRFPMKPLGLSLLVQAILTCPWVPFVPGVRHGVKGSLFILLLGVILLLRHRRPPLPGQRKSFALWLPLVMATVVLLILPEAFMWAGYPIRTGGWFSSAPAHFRLVLGFLFTYASELLSTYRHGLVLQTRLQERVVLLERRSQEVQTLNDDLRRQLSANAADLGRALLDAAQVRPSTPLAAGGIIDGRYEVLRMLGSGAMGSVFEVRRVHDSSLFAMKVISGTHTPVALARFAREAQNALQVESPHVVAVRDVGTRDDGTLYLVMDLVEGPTLSEEKEKFGRLDWALPILYQVAHGLAAVHRAGVVHRDIKPSNVILSYKDDHSNPTAKISDFGVSVLESSSGSWPRDAEGARRLTQTGHVVGTPKYMAPESHGGLGPTGPDSDVFSFGLLAREVLGFAPHHATCPAGLLLLAAPDMSLGSIGDVHPSLEPDVVRVLDDCLKANRKFRPSADEIADTLRGFSSRTDSRPISLGRRERENS